MAPRIPKAMSKASPPTSARASKSRRGAKDPDAPKRALSAYFIWLGATRKSITKEGMGVTDVSREAGRLWRGMTPKDKKKWEDAAAKDKVRYQKECAAYGR